MLERFESRFSFLQMSSVRLIHERQTFEATFDGGLHVVDPRPLYEDVRHVASEAELRLSRLESGFHIELLARLARHWRDFLVKLLPTAEIFALRALGLSAILPALSIVGFVAIVDGVVRRAVRKAGAGLESARIYHLAKRSIKPLLIWSCMTYLAIPIPVKPVWLIPVLFVALPVLLSVVVSRFKKYI